VSGPCALVSASLGTFSSSGAGSCVVKAYSAATTNYLDSSAQQTVTIGKRPVTVKATGISRVFGQSTPAFSIYTSVGSLASGDTLASLGTPTFTTSPTNPAVNVGSYTTAAGGLSNSNYTIAYDNTGTLSITQAGTTASVNVTPGTQQYSDRVTFSATLSPSAIGGVAPATSVTFYVGTQNMGTVAAPTDTTALTLTWTLVNVPLFEPVNPAPGNPPTGQMAPGSPTVTAVFGGVNPNFTVSNPTTSLTITKEDARVTYAGNLFVGIPLSATMGSITLIATISDITAVPSDPAYDAYPGDIRNATVTFMDFSNPTAPTALCSAPVLLVSGSDTKTGSVTCTFMGVVDNTGSKQYTVGIVVGNYYTRSSSTDDAVVTISQVGAGMITGGGYVALTNSGGTIAGNPGTQNNLGFNVKYNKSGTNLQGNLNTIVRRKESDGIQHVYQIKGNSMSSLAVSQLQSNGTWSAGCPNDPTSTAPCKAQFNGKANIQDITNPLSPVSVPGSGNSALQFNMTDYGSPGSSDTIGITVWNTSGGIWFSTNWVGTPPATVEQLMGGGNLVVH